MILRRRSALSQSSSSPKDYSVPALEKSIKLLNALSASGALTINELHERSAVAKSTIFVILSTLERHSLVEKTDDGKYRLGHGIFEWGRSFHQRLDLNPVARPYLEQLVAGTPYTAHLAVLAENRAVYIDKCEGGGFVRFTTGPGHSLPLAVSAVGKALLSGMDDEALRRLITDELLHGRAADAAHSPPSPEAALEEIAFVRKHGFAIDDGQTVEGVVSIGSPIRDASGAVVAAIDITALRKDLPAYRLLETGEAVRIAADRISTQLGSPAR